MDPAGGRTLFQEYAERWRVIQVHRSRTAEQVETYLRLHAYPTLGGRQLGAIPRSDVQAWVKDLTAVLAPGSVELVYRWVSSIFKAAVGDRLIAASPCINITLPKRNDAEVVPLTVGEVKAMAEAVPDRYRALMSSPAPWAFARASASASPSTESTSSAGTYGSTASSCRRYGVPEFGPPKSKAGFRTVPMPDVVASTLSPHLARYRNRGCDLVFTSRTGNALRRNTAGEMWHRAGAQAGLPEWATFHDLRHFYASLLIAKGCSVNVVQRRLGHQSAMETLDTYGHLWPDSEDETRAAVDEVLAGVTPVLSAV